MESIDSSTIDRDGSARVTVLRESTNAALTSPWIFVYLTKGSAAFSKRLGDRILSDQIAFEISGAWPVRATWLDNTRFKFCAMDAVLRWRGPARKGIAWVTYAAFPSVPHQLQENYQDNPGGTLRAEQFYYTLPDTPISDRTTVRIEPLPLEYNKKLERISDHWPEDVLVLARTRPLTLRWSDDKTLVVICDQCGRRLSDATNKLSSIYGVQFKFEGFVP